MATGQGATHYGLIGLAVMGANLTLNIADHGFPIAAYNRTYKVTEAFMAGEARGKPITSAATMKEFVASIERPRRIIILVKAGGPVDAVIGEVKPLLEDGDVLIDGGNSFFQDTIRRSLEFEGSGLHYMGMGVSGGEEGARFGPSLMPGGPREAYDLVAPALQKIAAQVQDGPCVTYIGPGGAGHYVKMVHNGVEYGLMQAYAEGFDLFDKCEYELDNAKIAHLWGQGSVVRSWLCELAARAFEQEGNDLAGLEGFTADSGEGRWTIADAMDKDVPTPVITSALFARFYSRGNGDFTHRMLAALRNQFGGHSMKTRAEEVASS